MVIGNPPWVFTKYVEWGDNIKGYLSNQYLAESESTNKSKARQSNKINLFAIFLIKSIMLLNKNGLSSLIIPNTILRATTYDVVRKICVRQCKYCFALLTLNQKFFNNVTASTNIVTLSKNLYKNNIIKIIDNPEKTRFNCKKNLVLLNKKYFLHNTSLRI